MMINRRLNVITSLYTLCILILLVLLVLVYPSRVFGGKFPQYLTDEKGIQLLKGEKQFCLLFQPSTPASKELLKHISSDVSLKLRLIGIELKAWEWWRPFLLIELSIVSETNSNIYSGDVSISFNMESFFTKNNIPGYSEVWSGSLIFANVTENDIRQYIKDIMDDFLNVYLRANPRKFSNE